MDIVLILGLTLMAGLAMPLGAWLAQTFHWAPDWLENELRHGIMAFGGGALLSAVALVLVPQGIASLTLMPALLCFGSGAVAFMVLDVVLAKLDTSASQLMAMLSDFIPESLALGASLTLGGNSSALLLALLMALQNIPEGFNAYRELSVRSRSARHLILIFSMMALLGPMAGLVGYMWLTELPAWVAAIMLFAAGGILYSVFQDIAPQAVLERHWAPPLGAILGFALGIAGFMLTESAV